MVALKSKLLPIAASIAVTMVFFLPFFASGGDQLSGDLSDNRLLIVILEHWRAVVDGQAPPTSPNFFAPVQGALAYSEAMCLFVPPYLLLRALTLNPYLAFQFTLVAAKILAFLALFALLRRAAGLSPELAAWAAALYAMSNMYAASLGHGQLTSHAFLPLILWLTCLAWDLLPTRPLAAHACAAAAAVIFALLFFTAYYIAFYFGLSAGLCFLIFLFLEMRQPSGRFPFRSALPLALTAASFFALGLIPFLVTYLPLYRAVGGRPYGVLQDQIMGVAQIVSPGFANVLWGGFVQSNPNLFQVNVPREIGRGWTPVTFVVFLIAAAGIWRRPKPTSAHRLGAASCLTVLLLALAATSFGGLQPWRLIHYFVPGASGVRVPQRINLVLNLAVVIVLAVWFRGKFRDPSLRKSFMRSLALTALLFLALVEQLNSGAFPGYSRHADLAYLGRVPAPPSSCRNFFVSRSDRPDPSWTQIDAMLLARKFNLPTLNGYSGLSPQGWKCEPQVTACAISLQNWARANNITAGLCALDLSSATWLPAVTE